MSKLPQNSVNVLRIRTEGPHEEGFDYKEPVLIWSSAKKTQTINYKCRQLPVIKLGLKLYHPPLIRLKPWHCEKITWYTVY